jgi:hypothetical protein
MWKVIYVASRPAQTARLVRALSDAGLTCRTRHVGDAAAGADEIMVIEDEVEDAQAVLARSVVQEDRGERGG